MTRTTRIRELRESLDIKQDELARHCNVSQSTVSLWESGATVPRKSALKKLSDRFGVPAGYLLGIDPTEPQELSDIDFALSGEIKALNDREKQDVLDYIRFKRSQRIRV